MGQHQCRAKISELAKSGLILVDLRATITGELYGDAVWRFAQLPRPARQPPSAAAQLPLQTGTKGNQGRHENLGPDVGIGCAAQMSQAAWYID